MFPFFQRHPSLRIILTYVAFAAAWMIYFDFVLGWMGFPDERLLDWHIYEDVAFALVTVVMLFLLLRFELSRRRGVEDALRRSEEMFHTLARLSPVGIFRSGADGRCSYVNESWMRITGIKAAQALGEGWAEGVYPADRESVLAAWRRCIGENASARLEYRFQRSDGTVAWVLGEVHPEQPKARAGFVGTITDITDRKQAELALGVSEERFRTLIEHIPAATCMRRIDARGSIVFVSPQIADMLGFEQAEWTADPELWFRRLHPEDQTRAVLELMHPETRHVSVEYRIRHKSGRWVWVVEEAAFLRDERGRAVNRLGLMLDVTQARQLEADLQRSHGRYEALVNSIDGVVWEMDAATLVYTFVSRQAERLTGVPRERWLNDADFWMSHVHADDRERVRNAYRDAARTLRPALVEYRLLAAGGRELWARDGVVATPEEGGGVRLCGVLVDVTESRRTAQEIQALNTELEQRVRQRTAELETANEELRSFNYSVSHDLRVPLRAIAGIGESLASGAAAQLDAEGREQVAGLLAAAQRMSRLIDDLLNLSRVNRAELSRDPVDLGELAVAVAADLRRAEPARQVNLKVSPGMCVIGDPRLLRLMLENLMGNAWKFTSKRAAPCVEVGVQRGAEGRCTYFVRDNGAGFEMEYADKLFRPFQRLHDATDFPGTGIGLATVQRIMQRHGGRVWAEGREGEGATFFFEFGG